MPLYNFPSLNDLESFASSVGDLFHSVLEADPYYDGVIKIDGNRAVRKSTFVKSCMTRIIDLKGWDASDVVIEMDTDDDGRPVYKAMYLETDSHQIRQFDLKACPDAAGITSIPAIDLSHVPDQALPGLTFVEHANLMPNVLEQDRPDGDVTTIGLKRFNVKALGSKEDTYSTLALDFSDHFKEHFSKAYELFLQQIERYRLQPFEPSPLCELVR